MKLRRVLIGVLVAAALAGSAGLYLRQRDGTPAGRYRVEAVTRGAVGATVTATGSISAVTTVQVGSQVSGIIARLYADFNSVVTRGQLLAELDPTPFRAQEEQREADLVRAEVEMRNAEIVLRRSERMLAQGLLPQADYDSAKTGYDASKAQVDLAAATLRQARANLSYTRIRSPIDGVVVARQYDIGQTVAASFQAPTLFTIAEDLTKMQVQADVDQSDIARVAIGQAARFTVDAYPDEVFSGAISQIRLNATQNQNVVTYPVIIDVPNPDGRLKPRMTADVTIEVARIADVLRVPNAALRFRPSGAAGEGEGGTEPAPGGASGEAAAGGAARAAGMIEEAARPVRRPQTVYVVGRGETLRAVPVKTGITDGRFTAILEGDLKEGDPIAVGPATTKSEAGAFPGVGTRPRGARPF